VLKVFVFFVYDSPRIDIFQLKLGPEWYGEKYEGGKMGGLRKVGNDKIQNLGWQEKGSL